MYLPVYAKSDNCRTRTEAIKAESCRHFLVYVCTQALNKPSRIVLKGCRELSVVAKGPGDVDRLRAAMQDIAPHASPETKLSLGGFGVCAGLVPLVHELAAMQWKNVSLTDVSTV